MINSHATQKHFGTKKKTKLFAFLKMRIEKKQLVKNTLILPTSVLCYLYHYY